MLRDDIFATDVEDMARMARRGAQLRDLEAAEIKRWGALADSLRIVLRDVCVRMKGKEKVVKL